MNRRISRLAVLLFIGDIFLTPLSLLTATWLRALLPFGKTLIAGDEILPLPVYILAIICWSGSLVMSGAYNFDRPRRLTSRFTQLVTASAAATILFAGSLYMTYRQVSRLQFAYIFILTLVFMTAFRAATLLYTRLVRNQSILGPTRVLFIGAGTLGREVLKTIRSYRASNYQVIGYLDDDPDLEEVHIDGVPVLGKLDDLLQVVESQDVSEVWSTLPPRAYDKLHALVANLERFPIRIKVIPDYFSLALVQANVEMLGGFPLIGLREPVIRGVPRMIKRAFDFVISLILVILSSPIMAAVAIAIRADSEGPILFRQTRVGENGKLFEMLKFRTMTADAESKIMEKLQEAGENEVVHKRAGDPRVTKVGRFLRRYSLDEVPQLINVLKGDMSLVGPRPELPWLVDRYRPWQRKRFAVPQGITGWWQINGRSEKPMHLNTDEDLYYIYNYSLWLDIKILLMTPIAVIMGKGAF
jgi:exopolysaccharide biosynthesis polyprenyl glycosylphosphotransferase